MTELSDALAAECEAQGFTVTKDLFGFRAERVTEVGTFVIERRDSGGVLRLTLPGFPERKSNTAELRDLLAGHVIPGKR